MTFKRVVNWTLILAFEILLILAICNVWIIESTNSSIYYSIDEVPAKKVALVLGTSDKLIGGERNPFFETRMDMAAQLYRAGKVKHVLVSGDNRSKYYNEPQKMKKALVEKGVPENAITLDYAGLRTLDSIVRCKEIFDQNDIMIVTQKFHCHRALFLSNFYNLTAVGMATSPIPQSFAFKTIFREIFARPMAIWDTYIIDKSPHFLGEKEPLIIVE